MQNLGQGVDLFPTLVDLTDGRLARELPERSLKPFLEGESRREDDFIVFAFAAYSDLATDYFDHPEPVYNPDSEVPFHTRVERLT